MQKLVDILADFFKIGDSYHYTLSRDKGAFSIGTMGLDDFKEYTEETIEEIAAHLIANGVTVQRWISLSERMPTADDADDWCQILTTDKDGLTDCYDYRTVRERPDWFSHWMPLPKAPGKEVQE